MKDGRLDGTLAVAAAVGDVHMKNLGVTSLGSFQYNPIEGAKYCLSASDGLFERLTVEQVNNLMNYILSIYKTEAVEHVR